MFFRMSTLTLALVLCVLVGGAVAIGTIMGRRLKDRPDIRHEPVGVVQGTLLGLVGLLLAFGLTMAVGRYDTRRAVLVHEADTIGTTFLRAQLLAEPNRAASLDVLKRYTDAALVVADQVPDSPAFDVAATQMDDLQRHLWRIAGDAVTADPVGTAPRLYVETLNDMFDAHSDRVASLRNRVPSTVLVLLVFGSAVALGALSLYLALLGRGLLTALVATVVVLLILFISFDLDRPDRGLITVPDRPLVDVRASMDPPPAATGP
jgi:hypothetical protein